MYLVVFTLRHWERNGTTIYADEWGSYPTYAEAKAKYDDLHRQDREATLRLPMDDRAWDLHIASICAPIVSTDYATPRDCMLHAQNFED
jgi:hypothetical protein